MTSENYVRLHGEMVFYGVESLDDEQAFRAVCQIENFFDHEPQWWTQVNFPAETVRQIFAEIRNALENR
ncbi:MAG: hypothetical protein K1Y36_11405 [Blastocatellia bacterium]|nr:hypothetical protein [Blastocatellia bacterium]